MITYTQWQLSFIVSHSNTNDDRFHFIGDRLLCLYSCAGIISVTNHGKYPLPHSKPPIHEPAGHGHTTNHHLILTITLKLTPTLILALIRSISVRGWLTGGGACEHPLQCIGMLMQMARFVQWTLYIQSGPQMRPFWFLTSLYNFGHWPKTNKQINKQGRTQTVCQGAR